jgi:hypothetical protein
VIEVVTDPQTLSRSASGAITGRLVLRSQVGSFPDEQWSDFPVVVLSWWINGLRELVAAERSSFEGMFMDGPFAFRVTLEGLAGLAKVAWIERGSELIVGSFELNPFLCSAAEAGSCILQSCRAHGWQSKDIEILEAALARAAA